MTPAPGSSDTPPPCRAMGSHCTSLKVVLRVSALEDGPASGDHEATWLIGHTDRITFLSDLWEDDGDLYIAAELHVPCRFLSEAADRSHCTGHGFRTSRSPGPRPPRADRRLGGDRFRVVDRGSITTRTLLPAPPPPRTLPVWDTPNPCATAPCRTADNTRGAACCRDLQVEIMCTTRERRLEALIRSRKRPYLCKVEREGAYSLSAEMISACGFLADDGVLCTLHGRTRADGRPAKPDLCSEWPEGAETYHRGCALIPVPGP